MDGVRCGTLAILLLLPTAGALAAAPGDDLRLNQDPTALPQGEVSIAVHPGDPQHLVATWIDWDAPRGQGNTTFHARSLDGGATWQTAETTDPVLPPLQARIDPAVALDAAGRAFVVFATPQGFQGGAWALRSTDGGLTFGDAVALDPLSVDKPWIAVDPGSGNVYVTWTSCPGGICTGGIRFSRSTDQGVTFSAPVSIGGGGTAMPAVGPAGQVYVIYVGGVNSDILLDRSLDGGQTWLAGDRLVTPAITNPLTGNNGVRIGAIPALAVDRTTGPHSGRLYVAWSDARNGDSDVLLVRSNDQGETWSAPLRVNDDYLGGGTDQFNHSLWVDDAGHLHVMFLDRRDDPDNLRFAVYLATSTDGGQSFGPDVRVSEEGLVQGGPPGAPNTWLGDYASGTGAGGANHLTWADGRFGDQDMFYRRVDDADFDEDGVLNDGGGDGQYANAPCPDGQTAGCDDNCPGTPNPGQADQDGDGVGDACDNCPGTPNADRHDRDRDGVGDACDPCPDAPDRPAGDPDGDGVAECTDNCPGIPNGAQTDADADGLGDACDPCPSSDANDPDADGLCAGADNCPAAWNPKQADGDGDGVGNVCDGCPQDPDAAQTDTDGDGAGDVCDCQPLDPGDRPPRRVPHLRPFKSGSTALFGWQGAGVGGPGSSGLPGPEYDAYSVSRGLLSTLRSTGSLGACLVQGIVRGIEDPALPPSGDGFFYLAQGQNFECGLGPAGFDSQEASRVNTDPGACTGHPFTDVGAQSEQTLVGTVDGTLSDTLASDDAYETITEESVGGISQAEHRWTFDVPAGGLVEWHLESFYVPAPGFEGLQLEFSADGVSFTQLTVPILSLNDPDGDAAGSLPPGTSGTVILRLIDPERTPGIGLDGQSVDQLWIRSIP